MRALCMLNKLYIGMYCLTKGYCAVDRRLAPPLYNAQVPGNWRWRLPRTRNAAVCVFFPVLIVWVCLCLGVPSKRA